MFDSTLWGLEPRARAHAQPPKNRLVSLAETPDFGGTSGQFVHFHFQPAYEQAYYYKAGGRPIVMTTTQVICDENRTDRWQFTCPRGHRTWEAAQNHFWCQRCASTKDVDGRFHQLRDKVSGERLSREEVVLQSNCDDDLELEADA